MIIRPVAGVMLVSSFVLLLSVLYCAVSYNAPSNYQGSWSPPYRPVDFMVDITNNLAIDVLYEHNFLNDNNIAFSPYGLTGILIALYEGVDGASSVQIKETMGLPYDRSIVRIGFRDIHRRLRSYFIPKEGFLAGLAFNNENVTFREEYKNILHFYGYDIRSTEKSDGTTTTVADQTTETINTMAPTTEGVTGTADSTETSIAMQTSTVDITSSSSSSLTTVPPTSEADDIVSTMTTESMVSSNDIANSPATEMTQTSTEPRMPETTEDSNSETMGIRTTRDTTTTNSESTEVSNFDEATSTSVRTTREVSATTSLEPTSTETNEADTVTSTINDDMSTTDTISTVSTDIAIDSTTAEYESQNEVSSPSERRRKSILNYDSIEPIYHDRIDLIKPHFMSDLTDENMGLQYTRSFLANGYNKVQITYMTYDAILEFAYVPYLRSLALKLPLDTMEYYLMILLPEYEYGVNQLIRDLKSQKAPTLRQINYMMTNTRVHAWVPTFMLKGFVVLTSDLQKLGICDPFEPRQDDFRPMTKEKNIYVRNIEQAITVTIRKYMEPSVKKRYAQNHPPVEFAATHPFLFFVMDAGIHVSLMAGKIVNPLNSRIL